jgi:hypothetical protein
MIYESLHILTKRLDYYIKSASGELDETKDFAILGNIAYLSGEGLEDLSNQVIVSLVSIEEDASLKNQNHFVKKNNQYEKNNPKVFANLNILISAYYPLDYKNSLKMLNRIVQFFQGESIIKYKDSPLPELAEIRNIESLEVNLEMMSLSFEQLNQLWGNLGGKIVPSVLYKARVVAIERDAPLSTGPAITHLKINNDKWN